MLFYSSGHMQSVQYDFDSITPALVTLIQAVCIYLNKSLQT